MESFLNYKDIKKDIPKSVFTHLKGLIEKTELPQNEETMKRLIEAWLTKRALFRKMVEDENLKIVSTMDKGNKNACIAITISGSIIAIGPMADDKREIKYTSIGMRTDVPESLSSKAGNLEADICCDKPIIFKQGPIKKTSAIMDLAISPERKNEKEQLASIKKANKKLKDDFIQVNKEALKRDAKRDILKNRNTLFQKWIILKWFIIGGIEKHIFMARAKILWLELFNKLYEAISKKLKDKAQKDNVFLDFTNKQFAKFIDDYKWYESEKKNFDIGLMKALEELPDYKVYKEITDIFIKKLD